MNGWMGGWVDCLRAYLYIYRSIYLFLCLSVCLLSASSSTGTAAPAAVLLGLGLRNSGGKGKEKKRNETKANWPLFIKAHSFPPSPRAEDYDERAARCPPRRVVVDHPAVHEMEHSGRLPRDGDDAHAAARERDVRERVE